MAFIERYITDDGTGTYANSTNPLTPCSIATAIAGPIAANNRLNIKSGTYTIAGSVLPSGTSPTPIVWRGYNTTIGDLDVQGRNANGTLNTTNFPVITILNTILATGAFTIFQNLVFTGAISNGLIGGTTADSISYIQCSFTNTLSHASARALIGDDGLISICCDFHCSGANHTAVVDADVSANFIGCRFTGTQAGVGLLTTLAGSVINCVFIGTGKTGGNVGFVGQAGTPVVLIGNTFYNLTSAITYVNGVSTSLCPLINNHCTDCGTFINNLYPAADVATVELYNRTRDNNTHSIRALAVTAGEVAGGTTGDISTDYVDASASPPNLTLVTTAPAKGVGFPAHTDIGAFQLEYPAGGGGGGGGSRAWASIG